MNTSPWLEIIVIFAVLAFFSTLIIGHFYKKKHNIPTGECDCCKGNKLVKQYRKHYPNKNRG